MGLELLMKNHASGSMLVMKEASHIRQEQLHEVTADRIVQEFGWIEGEPIPSKEIQEMVLKYEKELTAGLARNSYHLIKNTIYGRVTGLRATPGLGGCIQQKELNDKTKTLHAFFSTSLQDESGAQRPEDPVYRLVFVFATDMDRIQKEQREGLVQVFTGEDAFKKEKIIFQRIPKGILYGRQAPIDALPDIHLWDAPEGFADYQRIKDFLAHALRPAESFADAEQRIDQIWMRHHLPLKDARVLKRAIWEFGNYDFKERDGTRMVGKCLTVPNQFNFFVRKRYGIDLQFCELLGATRRFESYDPEERTELLAESGGGSSVHNASIYRKTVIIDWTGRQFDSNKPLPEILDLAANPSLINRIEIRPRATTSPEEKERRFKLRKALGTANVDRYNP